MNLRRGRLVLAACAALVFLGLVFRFDSHGLLDPDEGRNAEVAREMAASNDYLLPHLNGLPYVDKPVLYFATGALAMEALGPTVFAARLPSLLFTIGTLLITWWFARRVFGGEAGVVAAVVTAASPLTLAFARTVIMDSALTFFMVSALVAFYVAVEKTAGRRAGGSGPGWESAIAWASIALGVLTKGPIALALPLMVVVPYAVWRRAGKMLIDPVGPLLFVAIVLPWVRFVSQRVPDYLGYVLFTETFQRLTTPALQRTGPWWYFIPILIAGALPWSAVVLGNLRRTRGPIDHRTVFLALWILVPLVFFSFSQSKRPQYVVPLVPAIGLAVAGTWSQRGVTFAAAALTALGLACLTTLPQLPHLISGMTPEISAAIPAAAIWLGAIAICAAAVAFLCRGAKEVALLALCLPTAAIPIVSGRLMGEISKARSAETLARAMAPVMVDATEVVGVHVFPPSLPFYVHRILTVATDSARELTSNYLVKTFGSWSDAPGTPLRTGSWWQEAAVQCERPRIFVVRVGETEAWQFLAARLPLLAETTRYAAFGPCGQASLALRGPVKSVHRQPSSPS